MPAERAPCKKPEIVVFVAWDMVWLDRSAEYQLQLIEKFSGTLSGKKDICAILVGLDASVGPWTKREYAIWHVNFKNVRICAELGDNTHWNWQQRYSYTLGIIEKAWDNNGSSDFRSDRRFSRFPPMTTGYFVQPHHHTQSIGIGPIQFSHRYPGAKMCRAAWSSGGRARPTTPHRVPRGAVDARNKPGHVWLRLLAPYFIVNPC